jgi:hypothetical protein
LSTEPRDRIYTISRDTTHAPKGAAGLDQSEHPLDYVTGDRLVVVINIGVALLPTMANICALQA